MRATSVIPVVSGGITSYTILYSVVFPTPWDIGLTRLISIQIGDETSKYAGDLPYTLSLELKISHLSY